MGEIKMRNHDEKGISARYEICIQTSENPV